MWPAKKTLKLKEINTTDSSYLHIPKRKYAPFYLPDCIFFFASHFPFHFYLYFSFSLPLAFHFILKKNLHKVKTSILISPDVVKK